MNNIDVLSRWFHVGTAIVLLGGAFYMRFILLPVASQLPEEAHQKLRELTRNRWKRVVHIGILLLLLTGFYNYLNATPAAEFKGRYHMLMGIKILIALLVFFVASALVGRAAAFERMRQNSKRALGLIVLLGFIIVGISGYLRVAGTKALVGSLPTKTVAPAAQP